MFNEDQGLKAIREGIKAMCLNFPNAYWREKDRTRTYPTEFVKSLSDHDYLGCLIPEEYGGSGLTLRAAAVILEEIHRSGGNGAACHAQMYIMGTLLQNGSVEQKKRYLSGIADGSLRLQAFGVTEPSSGTDTLALKTTARKDGDYYIINGQKVPKAVDFSTDLYYRDLQRDIQPEFMSRFNDGIQDYVAGDWLSSKKNLSEALKIMPLDGPTRTLYRVLKSYDFRAPSDWRGYRALTSKT